MLRQLVTYDHVFFFTDNLPIPDCRNKLVEDALDSNLNFTHLLMVDDDVILPSGAVDAMFEMDKKIVLVDYPSHYMGANKNMGNVAYESDKRKEILWGGLGCTLVKREVFDKLKRPYFRRGGDIFDVVGKDKKKVFYKKSEGNHGGEDYEFFKDCRNAGMIIHQVEGMVCGHAKVMKHVGVVQPDKYISCHDIKIEDKIDRPWK